MPDFNEFVRNLYTSKNRELTEDKLKYIEETYKGKEEDFVKNFYSTIGEELSEEKFNYIKDTYLKKKEQQVLYGNQPFGGKEEEPLLPLTSSTVSPSASKPPKSTTPSASTGKLPATTAPTSKAAKDEYIPVKAEMLIDGYSPEMERNRQKNYTQGYQRAYKKGQEYATSLEQTAVKVNQMDAQLEQLKGNPEQYNALVEQRNALAEQMRVVNDSLKGEIAKMDIYQKGLSVTDLKREINEDTAFNRMTVGVNEFQKMVLNTIPMMDRAATYLSGKVIGMDDKELSDAIQLNQDLKWGKIKEISKRLTEENEALVENFTSKTAWGEMTNGSDVATVSDLAAKELLQTIPVTLGLVATYINPYVGGAVTIFGTAGNKIDEMDVENPNMSEGAKITNALATGGLEYVTERVFGSIPIIGRAIGSKSEVGKKIFQNVVVETWTKYAKKMGFPADVIEEVSTEMLNTLGENYTDYMTGKTSELDLTKGLGQTFTTALSMAATLSGGGRAIKYGSKKINELTAETKKLKEAAANPDLKPDVVTTIEEKVIQNNEEIANEAEAEKKIFDAMPNKDYEEATALIQENQSLQEQLDNNEIPEEIIPVIERKIVDNNAIIEDIKQRQNKDAIQESSTVENEISSGDTSARTDVGGAEDGGTSSIIDKREPNKEPVIQEGEAKEEVKPVKEEITPEQIETGRQEVSAVKEGKIETANPIRLFKGLFGKKNPDGTRKSAHPNAKGVFSAVDGKVAERYKGEDGIGTFDIPAGTTMEVIRLAVRNVPMSKFREQETEAINASDAQIVKLITLDAKGAEEQYIIKDPALVEKMQKSEDVKQTKEQEDAVQEQTAGQVPVQSEAEVSEGVEGGKPKAEPKEATEEKQEEVEGEVNSELKDVESTAKALGSLIGVKKSSIGVKLRSLVGIITHNGSEVISKFDSSKIKGQTRGRYGKGFYFSSLFKNFDYGDKSTYLDSSQLNLLDGDVSVSQVLNKLQFPQEVSNSIYKLERLLAASKTNKEYNEISNEIKRLEKIKSSFDKNSEYIKKALEKAIEENPNQSFGSFLESLESRVIESNKLQSGRAVEGLNESLNNLVLKSGFDGIYFTEGNEILIIPQEKLNKLLVTSQEQFISEAYHSAKKDGNNPELVKAVEELLGDKAQAGEKQEKAEFPDNLLKIAKELDLSPQQIQNTYNKYDGSKKIEDITTEDYKAARVIGDKVKIEATTKAFDALLQVEAAEKSASPSAQKAAQKTLSQADEKALKEAAKVMEHIDEIRAKLQESGVIESTSCKWGK